MHIAVFSLPSFVVAVILHVPLLTGVTFPVLSTVAIFSSLLSHISSLFVALVGVIFGKSWIDWSWSVIVYSVQSNFISETLISSIVTSSVLVFPALSVADIIYLPELGIV